MGETNKGQADVGDASMPFAHVCIGGYYPPGSTFTEVCIRKEYTQNRLYSILVLFEPEEPKYTSTKPKRNFCQKSWWRLGDSDCHGIRSIRPNFVLRTVSSGALKLGLTDGESWIYLSKKSTAKTGAGTRMVQLSYWSEFSHCGTAAPKQCHSRSCWTRTQLFRTPPPNVLQGQNVWVAEIFVRDCV